MKGTSHDKISIALTPLIAIAFSLPLPGSPNSLAGAIALMTGYSAGWLFLSPDLDLKQSRPSQRWGPLSFLWQPYRAMHRHRGWSHRPLVGTAGRLLYATVLLAVPSLIVAQIIGATWPDPAIYLWDNAPLLARFGLGVELAALLHLFCDYCPVIKNF
jgi:uncharacterized metal-binding protein